jgi:glycosyltransferase involved in cell wall biosynthesis
MDKKIFFIRNVRKFFALLRQACKLSIWLEDQGLEKSDAFYSYWMNEWALALTILKKRRKINKFIFRVNGYDIWNERHAGNYLPFRYLIYSQTEKVIALSESSEKYIKDLNIFPDKIEKCYFGTKDFGELEERERDEYVIFSCSSAIPLKRLDKIAKVICSLDFKVTWHHHGDGLTMTEVNKIMTAEPENVSFINTKKVDDYFEVLQMQKKMAPDLVINLSSTEGLPVTLIEAISFGIPILANNVGSCYEIANQTTGVIVKKEASIQEIAAEIKGLKLSGRAQKERSIIRDYWLKNFSDEKIYGSFAKDIKIIFK